MVVLVSQSPTLVQTETIGWLTINFLTDIHCPQVDICAFE